MEYLFNSKIYKLALTESRYDLVCGHDDIIAKVVGPIVKDSQPQKVFWHCTIRLRYVHIHIVQYLLVIFYLKILLNSSVDPVLTSYFSSPSAANFAALDVFPATCYPRNADADV